MQRLMPQYQILARIQIIIEHLGLREAKVSTPAIPH
jgi:hypothetical protein